MRAAWFAVALLTACASAPPAHRADAAPDALPSQVVVSAHLPAPLTVQGLQVHFDDGTRQWTVPGTALAHVSGRVWRGEPQATATSGTLRVRYELASPDGQLLSTGAIELPLQPDWIHGVDIHAAIEDPRRHCMGCLGAVEFPLAAQARSADARAVFVVWGGNSITSPVVY